MYWWRGFLKGVYKGVHLTIAFGVQRYHYCDVIIGPTASQITSTTSVLNRLFGHRSKKTSKLRVTGLCVGNSPETGEFPAQMASNAENVSIWWRHHDVISPVVLSLGPDHITCTLTFNKHRNDKLSMWQLSQFETQAGPVGIHLSE